MDGSSPTYEGVVEQPEPISTHGPNDVAVLGGARAAAASSLHPEVSPAEHPSGAVTAANILRLLECQNYRCALTGRRLTPEVASLDHVVPVADGGEHRIENSQVLHKDVNRASRR